LIRNYLTTCTTHTTGDDDECEEVDGKAATDIVCAHVPLSVRNVHGIIEGMRTQSNSKQDDEDTKISNTLVKAVQLGASMWDVSTTSKSSTGIDTSCDAGGCQGATTENVAAQGSSSAVVKPRASMLPNLKVT
jgi:hypothetical protein